MYQCKLVDKKGYLLENFFRNGDSAQDVLETLQSFHHADGTWKIYEDGELMASGKS